VDRRVDYDANQLKDKVVSPYLRRPLRSLSEALAARHDHSGNEFHSFLKPPQITTEPLKEG